MTGRQYHGTNLATGSQDAGRVWLLRPLSDYSLFILSLLFPRLCDTISSIAGQAMAAFALGPSLAFMWHSY